MSAEVRKPINTVRNLQRGIMHGGEQAFNLVPMHLKTVIERKEWKTCLDKTGHPFRSFEAFVNYPLWWGLQSTIDELKAFCIKNEDVRRLIDGAVEPIAGHGEIGGGHSVENRGDNITSARGTNPTYTLKRLKRDRPDLAEKVVAGEMSANAAAIEAGFRKKLTPFEQVVKLLPKLTKQERNKLLKLLNQEKYKEENK